ncbi:uncharacterized protein BT62DRAFT_920520 [Guyanagaster necrorhizus]|uniref:CCHC-type domain-containing protein n=1 Tax=Guyanagaster necrorhizus TaxID=856835 RepID=A0A9P7VR89_9AGAR|nr:uncharacterized protein BT62DRAFT_920520 [Guyanagaster necrorhizus MCA 3950]KAG7445240.1 hypothetical protein BT62DRAFT_920520 [Guyanagaster necrorhizus MCA 3950]
MAEIIEIAQFSMENAHHHNYDHNCHANNMCTNAAIEVNNQHDQLQLRKLVKFILVQFLAQKKKPWDEKELSKKEQAEYLADGHCFCCEKAGHKSRDCPDGHLASGKHSGPSGLSSASICVALKEADRVTQLASASSTQFDLQLNSIDMHGLLNLVPAQFTEFCADNACDSACSSACGCEGDDDLTLDTIDSPPMLENIEEKSGDSISFNPDKWCSCQPPWKDADYPKLSPGEHCDWSEAQASKFLQTPKNIIVSASVVKSGRIAI